MRHGKNKGLWFSDQEWDEIVKLYSKGQPTTILSKRFSISRNSILRQLRKRGMTVRNSAAIRRAFTANAYTSTTEKICGDCHLSKAIGSYGKDNSRSDKLRNVCKPCDLVRSRKYSKNKSKSQIQRDRLRRKEWRKKNPAKQSDYSKRYYSSLNGRFIRSKHVALKQGKVWTLSVSSYKKLIAQSCEYCGYSLPVTGSGLDRLDNSKGYTLNNVTPCCTICNLTRRDQFTPDEMRRLLGPAVRNLREARLNSH